MKEDQTTLTPGIALGGMLQHPCILLGWWHPTVLLHRGLSMESPARTTDPLAAFILWVYVHGACRLVSDSCDTRQGCLKACLGPFFLLSILLQTCLD